MLFSGSGKSSQEQFGRKIVIPRLPSPPSSAEKAQGNS
ncbi:F-box domain-containing protein [Psidium guajava]|nr:F-box domain-containing protein [Psidium guajava]